MATILVDDTIIQDVLENRRGRVQLLQQLLAEGHLLACCAPTVAEIISRGRSSRKVSALLHTLEYLPVSERAAVLAGNLRARAAHRQQELASTEAVVAAVALTHETSLLTDRPGRYPVDHMALYPVLPRPKRAAARFP